MSKKLKPPFKYKVTGPDNLGFYLWRHIQEEGDLVYDRGLETKHTLEAFLADRYGWAFTKKVIKDLEAFK